MAITRFTQYDPIFHSNIPGNFRFDWGKRTNRPLDLTDEEIFILWRDSFDYEWEDDDTDQDATVRQMIHDALDAKDSAK